LDNSDQQAVTTLKNYLTQLIRCCLFRLTASHAQNDSAPITFPHTADVYHYTPAANQTQQRKQFSPT